MTELNVLGGPLEPCGLDPLTGWFRDGSCACEGDPGVHAVCVVATAEFLAHQYRTGNDLLTPQPQWQFPGLVPGDRWCVVAGRWLQAYFDGAAAPVILASTSARALEIVPLAYLREHAADVPDTPEGLE